MNRFNPIPVSFALVAVLVLGATRVLADPNGVHSIKVGYADLDLNTQAGAATLYDRIRGAARQVCGYEGQTFTDQALWRSCFNGAISDAVATVNNPRLTALHQGKSPALIASLSK
jgi:UrcA family protein